MALWRASAPRRNEFRRELVRLRMRGVISMCKHYCSCDGAALQCGFAFIRPALLVLRQEINCVALERSLELVAIKIPGQLFSFLLQLHAEVNRRAIEIRVHDPSSRNAAR